MIVWTDCETSGLMAPKDGHLLEVALVVTDDDLAERAATSVVLLPVDNVGIDEIEMDIVAREMHEKSGLLAEIRERGLRRYEGEQLLISWLAEVFCGGDESRLDLKGIPLAGSTVMFDRNWEREHMPKLERLFSHRSIDASALTEIAQRWAPAVYASRPKQEKGVAHRALEDARNSVEYLRYYRRCGFVRAEGAPRATVSAERREELLRYFHDERRLECGCAFLGSDRVEVCAQHVA